MNKFPENTISKIVILILKTKSQLHLLFSKKVNLKFILSSTYFMISSTYQGVRLQNNFFLK